MRRTMTLLILLTLTGCGTGDGHADIWTDPGPDDGTVEAEGLDTADFREDIGPDEGTDPPPDEIAQDDGGGDDVAAEDIAPEDVDGDGALSCPPPGVVDCSPGPGSGEDCIDAESCFITAVQDAVRWVISNRPELFDTSGDCEIVLDEAAYQQAVAARITDQGLCGFPDPNSVEEVVVKHNNAYSENFDILASTGCARYGPAIYTSTCIPAWL